MELNNKEKISRVKLTLKFGWFNGENQKKILGVYIGYIIIFLLGIVLAITMLSIEQIRNPDSIGAFVGALIAITIGFSLVPIILSVIIFRNEKIRKEIELWIHDAIEINAYLKKTDIKYWLGIPLVKFKIEFDVDGIHYTRTSDEEHRGFLAYGRPKGYFANMTEYIDKKVKILYSPKYDQMMILKDI